MRLNVRGGIKMVTAVFALVTAVMLVAIVVLFVSENRKKSRCTRPVVATVIDYEERWSRDRDGYSSYTYYPVISYYVNGQEYCSAADYGTNPPVYELGDRVDILYNQNNPTEFYIPGSPASFILYIIFGAVGMAMLIVTIGLIIMRRRYSL